MISAAEIKLWGKVIAAISMEEGSPYVYFRYNDDFLNSGIELSPIMMPLLDVSYQFRTLSLGTFKGLPGLLADSLPDKYGNKIIDTWLHSQGRSLDSFNIIERLCYIGKRGMGALEFHPVTHKGLDEVEDVEITQLVKLSNDIINSKTLIKVNQDESIQEIIKVGTSAGGARAKAIIAYHEQKGLIKSGQIDAGRGFTYWLLKLDGIDQAYEATFTRREYAYYLMALEAKITMSESRLLEKDGLYHFMTKRFDRIINKSGEMEKLHMQTLGAISHVDYNEPGMMSYEDTITIMESLKLQKEDYDQFYRRMVFNVMARNQDDHVKNISFLMDKQGNWSLSPAYDITFAYNPNGQWTSRHQMTINAKDKDLTLNDLLIAARNMKITEDRSKQIINEVRSAILKWEIFAQKAWLKETEIHAIKKYFLMMNE